MRHLALIGSLLVGCGDNTPDPTQPRSGARLKLVWYEYESGARELETAWYHDAGLGQRCTARTWSDGRRYCTPAFDDAVFINDTCTRALGRTLIGRPPAPLFATTFALAGEPAPVPSRLFRRGQPTLPPPAFWQRGVAGCIPVEVFEDYAYFELGAEIPSADLVHLSRAEPNGGGELAVISEVGDDELRAPVALYDRTAGAECTTTDLPSMISVPCTPVTAVVAAYYLDPACSQHVVAVPLGQHATFAAYHDVRTSCSTYYRVGRELVAPRLYQASGTACVEISRPGGQRFFEMDERYVVPALARVRDGGTQRIRAIVRINGTLHLRDPLMYDAELDIECRHDSGLRCVPRTMALAVPARAFFADPQCEMPLGLAFVPRGACDPPQRFASDGGDYYELGEPYAGPIYVPSTGDTCSGFAPPPPLIAYRIGRRTDPSVFARAELVIDP
jgi:hypothetical protein